jgi:hypothetical protein
LRQEEQDELDEVLLQLKQIFSGGRNNNTNIKENSSTSPKKGIDTWRKIDLNNTAMDDSSNGRAVALYPADQGSNSRSGSV